MDKLEKHINTLPLEVKEASTERLVVKNDLVEKKSVRSVSWKKSVSEHLSEYNTHSQGTKRIKSPVDIDVYSPLDVSRQSALSKKESTKSKKSKSSEKKSKKKKDKDKEKEKLSEKTVPFKADLRIELGTDKHEST